MRNLSEVYFPWVFRKKLIDKFGQSEFLEELCNNYTILHDYTNKLETEIYKINSDNIRLTHENEFMLKLVNERANENS